MNGNEDIPSFRGPLKYLVETPAPQLEAGKKISVNLLITNPYDVPVKIISARTALPAHFVDADEQPQPFWNLGKETAKTEAKKGIADAGRLQVISGKSLTSLDNGDPDDDQVILQPGNTIVRAFTLKTRQTLFFTPSVHSLNAQVCYQIDKSEFNFDTVRYQLNIRAQFKSLIIGSLIGAVVGTLLRFSAPLKWDLPWIAQLSPFFIALVTGMLAGAVLVIAFARKKDAQPFITIEDFWGGFFVGFVAGYVGKEILAGVLPDAP